MKGGRDIIVFDSINAVGKSEGIASLCEAIKKRGVACQDAPTGTIQYGRLAKKATEDREQKHHIRLKPPSVEPFIVTDNELPNQAFREGFQGLIDLPQQENHFYVTDLPLGINTNPEGSLSSNVDYSSKRIAQALQNGDFPNSWLSRVYAVIHPVMDEQKRRNLFEKRNKMNEEKAERERERESNSNLNGVLYIKPEEVLYMYGQDDFSEIEPLYREAGVPFIRDVENDGTLEDYALKLDSLAEELVEPIRGIESEAPKQDYEVLQSYTSPQMRK